MKTKKIPKIRIILTLIVVMTICAYGGYSIAKNLKIKQFNDSFFDNITLTPKVDADEAEESEKSIPVLMYHSINRRTGMTKLNPYVVSPKDFKEEMEYISKNKYTVISLDDLYYYMVQGKPVPKKSVVITFDDGYEDFYKNAYPVLKKYNFKATIFMIAGYVDKGNYYLNSNQLRELQNNGIDIESHTVFHERLSTLSYQKQLKTLADSKIILERFLNKKVNYIAFPYGSYNLDTMQALKKTGYLMAFTIKGGDSKLSQGLYTLHRVFMDGYNLFGVSHYFK